MLVNNQSYNSGQNYNTDQNQNIDQNQLIQMLMQQYGGGQGGGQAPLSNRVHGQNPLAELVQLQSMLQHRNQGMNQNMNQNQNMNMNRGMVQQNQFSQAPMMQNRGNF